MKVRFSIVLLLIRFAATVSFLPLRQWQPPHPVTIRQRKTPRLLADIPSKRTDDNDAMCKSNDKESTKTKDKPQPGWLRRTFPSAPWHKLPNWLTYVRCAAIPGVVVLFYNNLYIWTSVVFAATCATDWLDGYLARRWGVTSAFGAFLDPVADKMIVSTSLILLAGQHGPIVAIPAAAILARELAVTSLREWMAQEGLRDIVKVGFQGKVKTALTMLSITMMFLPQFEKVALPLLYVSAVLTVTSGSVYFRAAAPILMKK